MRYDYMGDSAAEHISAADRVLMIIGNEMIHGRGRLQRYGFLLSEQYGSKLEQISKIDEKLKFYADWKPHYYSPFSKKLEDDVDNCIDKGFVGVQDIDKLHKLDRYFLTYRGSTRWRRMCVKHKENMKAIVEKVGKLQTIPLEDLILRIDLKYPQYAKHDFTKDSSNRPLSHLKQVT